MFKITNMCGTYVKTLLLIFTVTMMAFIVPNAFAATCGDGNDYLDDLYLNLTPTHDTITIDFSPEYVGCELPNDEVFYNFIIFEETNPYTFIETILGEETSFTVSGLEPDTEYKIKLYVYFDGNNTNNLVGDTSQIIRTLAVPEPCVNLDASYMTLSSTSNTITASWSLDPLCSVYLEVPSGSPILNNLHLTGNIVVDVTANSYTFSNLLPATEYTVSNAVYFVTIDDGYEDRANVGIITKTIQTKDEIYVEPEPEPCVIIDDSYLILTSTADTITANWLTNPICGMPSEAILHYGLILDDPDHNSDHIIPDAVSGDFFSNLESDTEHSVELNVYYQENVDNPTWFYWGDITESIYTKDVFYIEPVEELLEELDDETNGSGCSGDCTPPTIGLDDDNKRLVNNGFSYNNNPVDVIAWHTPYPLITAIVNQTNTVEITVYDNGGIFNLDMVQFGLGLEDLGQALHDVEVLIEVHLETVYSENNVIVEKVVIRDSDNLIDTFTVFAVTSIVDCIDDEFDEDCLKITLQYSYREATINNMMVVNVADKARNTQNFYFNDGVEVIGESMNPTPFVILPNKLTNQQTENLTLTLYRTDKINHIWMDNTGVEYLKTGDNEFNRITAPEPYTCNDPLLSEINVPTRSNCHFRALVSFWNQ